MPSPTPSPVPFAAGDSPVADPLLALTGFARALRAEGVPADAGRVVSLVRALAELDPTDVEDLYWAGRVTLCAGVDDLARYEAVFERWWRGAGDPLGDGAGAPRSPGRPLGGVLERGDEPGEVEQELGLTASGVEVLRHREVTELDEAARAEVNRLVRLLRPRAATRRTRRREPGRGRGVDPGRTIRAMIRNGGEPAQLLHRRRRRKARRLVLLVDVSGSMGLYADLLLRFAHAAVRTAPASTEVFTLGTRLTRVTRHLRHRDAEEAFAGIGSAVPDWSGGTRLGESLRAFLDIWGHRGMARQAVVVVASDGWERGGADLLGAQAARLRRLAHRVVWVNPHCGREGFVPATAGMRAVLPHIDGLLPGNSFGAMEGLAEVIAHA
jgi:uncharacterized protein with von Willebrand factor type A (vWA) domain